MTAFQALLAILRALATIEPIAQVVIGWIAKGSTPSAPLSPLAQAVSSALDVFAAADPTIEAELTKWMTGADSGHALRPQIDELLSSAEKAIEDA